MRLLVDIGGTHTRLGRVGASGIDSPIMTQFPTQYDYEVFLADMRSRAGVSDDLEAVCVSFGVALANGKIVGAGKMPSFVGRDLVKDLTALFGCPTFVAHDCICALLHVLGGRPPSGSVGYVTISSGIGAAVACEVAGTTFLQRVRVGHHVIQQGGIACKCGRAGCLSAYTDSKTLESEMGRSLSEVSDIDFWKRYVNMLSVGIANFAVMMGLDQLYLGGGVSGNSYVREQLPGAVKQQVGTKGGYSTCSIDWLVAYEYAPMLGAKFLADGGKFLLKG